MNTVDTHTGMVMQVRMIHIVGCIAVAVVAVVVVV